MTNAGQPPTTEEHPANLEMLIAEVQEIDAAINLLVTNIQQFSEKAGALSADVDVFATRLDLLIEQAASSKRSPRISSRVRRIWDYLRDRNGGSSPPQ